MAPAVPRPSKVPPLAERLLAWDTAFAHVQATVNDRSPTTNAAVVAAATALTLASDGAGIGGSIIAPVVNDQNAVAIDLDDELDFP